MGQGATSGPVVAVAAASILLLRDGPDGLEVLMMERHQAMGFAAGAMVFPGGKIDPGDVRPGTPGTDDLQRFRQGAMRELFEEAGILLAADADGEPVDPAHAGALAMRHRDKVVRQPARFAAMLDAENLHATADDLVHYAHWITPEPVPRRFDTHFFAAPAPPGQVAVSDGREAVHMAWLNPGQALDMGARGEKMLMFPTRLNLERLSRSDNMDAALTAARESAVVTVMPKPLIEDDVMYLTIPPEAGYGPVKIRRDEIPEAATGDPGPAAPPPPGKPANPD